MDYVLVCLGCGRKYARTYRKQICGKCEGILEVSYTGREKLSLHGARFWDYEDFLPRCRYRRLLVGGTKLVLSADHENLLLKLELQNPTRSFKDRGSIIEIAKALEYGYDEIVCASTGNMAYSLSYYSDIMGIKAKVYIGGRANRDKLRDIRETGSAEITMVRGDFTKAQKLALNYSVKNRNAFLTGDYCYRKEGQKTIAYEVLAKMKYVDYLIVPVGNATLLSGVLRAIEQAKRDGAIKKAPRVVAVQSKGCAPLVDAFNRSRKISYTRPDTDADAIAVGFPTYGDIAIAALKKNGGSAVSVGDEELLKEQRLFYKKYGVIAEMASVACISAFKRLKLGNDKKCVGVITGGNV